MRNKTATKGPLPPPLVGWLVGLFVFTCHHFIILVEAAGGDTGVALVLVSLGVVRPSRRPGLCGMLACP